MIGKEITLRWLGMTTDQYEVHEAQLVNDVPISFDPQDGSSQSFTVEVRRLSGKMVLTTNGEHRVDVEMDLLFLSEGA